MLGDPPVRLGYVLPTAGRPGAPHEMRAAQVRCETEGLPPLEGAEKTLARMVQIGVETPTPEMAPWTCHPDERVMGLRAVGAVPCLDQSSHAFSSGLVTHLRKAVQLEAFAANTLWPAFHDASAGICLLHISQENPNVRTRANGGLAR